jgi:hypothetical protein
MRYLKYSVARWGAYVDFWELLNEQSADQRWIQMMADYVHSIDPYHRPVTTSWEQPELSSLDFNSPHWYAREAESEVVRAIVTSPEFLGGTYRNAKVKTPLEFVVSAVRASGAAVDDAIDLARRIADMGMPLYMQQPPTGYKDTADAWVSTSGLLARLNFALDLAGGRVVGVRSARMAGLVLGSPEFQRR